MTIHHEIVHDLISRIPSLRELHGYARIEAEQAIENALQEAVEYALFVSAARETHAPT